MQRQHVCTVSSFLLLASEQPWKTCHFNESYTAVSSLSALAFAQWEWDLQHHAHYGTPLQLNNLDALWSSLSRVRLLRKCVCLWSWQNVFVGNLGSVRKGGRFKRRWGEVERYVLGKTEKNDWCGGMREVWKHGKERTVIIITQSIVTIIFYTAYHSTYNQLWMEFLITIEGLNSTFSVSVRLGESV